MHGARWDMRHPAGRLLCHVRHLPRRRHPPPHLLHDSDRAQAAVYVPLVTPISCGEGKADWTDAAIPPKEWRVRSS